VPEVHRDAPPGRRPRGPPREERGAGGRPTRCAAGASTAAAERSTGDGEVACDSFDCGVFYERAKARAQAVASERLAEFGLRQLEEEEEGEEELL